MLKRNAVTALGILLVMLVAFVVLVFGPQYELGLFPNQKDFEKDIPQLTNEYRRTWATAISGLVLILGLYFTWRTVHATQEGQLTERYTNAIDQLGAMVTEGNTFKKNVEVRMGGIYALERIARESEKDHWPIMEILAAYVRHCAPLEKTTSASQVGASGQKTDEHANTKASLDPDIQAVMHFIRRRKYYYGKKRRERWLGSNRWLAKWLRGQERPAGWLGRWTGRRVRNLLGVSYRIKPLDLHDTDLRGAPLWDAHLEGMRLEGVNLEGGELEEAHLRGTNLRRAVLAKAKFVGADLRDADLRDADLRDADLTGADLRGAKLTGATFEGADVREAKFGEVEGSVSEQLTRAIGYNEVSYLSVSSASPHRVRMFKRSKK